MGGKEKTMKLKPIEEQVVVVMGASSGIGRETALRFARRGAKVIVSARGEAGLRSLVDEIRSEGGEAVAVVADVAEFDQVKAVVDRAAEEYGRLDTWAHLASVSLFAPLGEITPEEFKQVVEVDLMGQVYGAMAALPHLKREGRGALVHVSSVLARRSVPLQSPYCASKHGVEGFVESLRVELKRESWPIGVTNVLPASINTPFFDKSRTKLGYKPMSIPPFYPPGVVADAILYAAENAPRDLIVGGAGKALLLTQRLSPRLMDAIMLYVGFRWQQTDELKREEAPDYLFEPVEGNDRIEGDLGKWSFSRSLSTWLDIHPRTKRGAILGGTLLALATLRAKR
jgi:NAD(P)-dependent dehydrogenase (short-subunit alcohol dehydrogenase family)